MGTFLESSILCGTRPQSAVLDTTKNGLKKTTQTNLNKILKCHLSLCLCVLIVKTSSCTCIFLSQEVDWQYLSGCFLTYIKELPLKNIYLRLD